MRAKKKEFRICEAARSRAARSARDSGFWYNCIVRQAKASFLGVVWIVACSTSRVRFRHFFFVVFPRLLFVKGSRRRLPIELRGLIAARLSLSLSLNVCWCKIKHVGYPILFSAGQLVVESALLGILM